MYYFISLLCLWISFVVSIRGVARFPKPRIPVPVNRPIGTIHQTPIISTAVGANRFYSTKNGGSKNFGSTSSTGRGYPTQGTTTYSFPNEEEGVYPDGIEEIYENEEYDWSEYQLQLNKPFFSLIHDIHEPGAIEDLKYISDTSYHETGNPFPYSKLLEVGITQNSLELVQFVIKKHDLRNMYKYNRIFEGFTLLELACYYNNKDVVKYLYKQGFRLGTDDFELEIESQYGDSKNGRDVRYKVLNIYKHVVDEIEYSGFEDDYPFTVSGTKKSKKSKKSKSKKKSKSYKQEPSSFGSGKISKSRPLLLRQTDEMLRTAVNKGSLESIKLIMEEKGVIDGYMYANVFNGMTLMEYACVKNRPQIINYLYQIGFRADPEEFAVQMELEYKDPKTGEVSEKVAKMIRELTKNYNKVDWEYRYGLDGNY